MIAPPNAPDAHRLAAADLCEVYQRAFGDLPFVVVSNREPYEHYWDEAADEVTVRRPAGGLVAAIDPLMQALGGTWIAWGSGDRDADVVDAAQQVRVPPEDPRYTLHRLWLDPQDVHEYYAGYANQFLWPLCHLRPALTRTRAKYWDRYVTVNRRFGEAIIQTVPAHSGAAVWIHDYHLALTPGVVRAARPDLTLAHFWHIPFPPIELFRIASQAGDLLRGLVANDLLGFHLPLFCDNFLRAAQEMLPDADVDWDRRAVVLGDHTCYVRAFPISIDVAAFHAAANAPGVEQRIARLRARYAPYDGWLGVGVDRIDYSKGLEEKLKALDILFDCHPELRGRFTFVQIAVSSRSGIESYDWLSEKLERMVWSINDRYGSGAWRPIHLLRDPVSAERLALYYRAADVCIVNSLQDGMNLVAKEYIASQADDSQGVLVLSRFAGAAEELDGALDVNPYDPEATAAQVHAALMMSADDRRLRMHRLRHSLRSIYDWMDEIFDVWGAVAHGGEAPHARADALRSRP